VELLDPGSVHSELAMLVADLDQAEELVIAEVRADSLVIWRIRRNQAGTPQVFYRAKPWADLTWDDLFSGAEFKRLTGDGDIPIAFCQPLAGIPDLSEQTQFLDWFRAAYPAAMLVETRMPVDDLMLKTLASVPLGQWYELAVLRVGPTGRLMLSVVPLFPPGASRGDERRFSVHCDTGTAHGISFAVIARDAEAYRLVSVESAQVPPGNYALTAVLLRPGRVRFEGLPVSLRPDQRSWPEIIATIPDRIPRASDRGVHLICLVETCGPQRHVRRQAELAAELVELAVGESSHRLAVSLISYGTHSFARNAHDEPVTILAWAAPAAQARPALDDLLDQSPADNGYPRAARLECALAETAARVTGDEGRPVLVAIGSRPPFPSRVDPVTEILPCPYRNDWKRALVRLGEQNGVSLGAITDNDSSDAWRFLGRDAFAQPYDVDAVSFAAKLGLLRQDAVPVPFPLADPPKRDHAR
jgi:hypothetical protein